MIKDKDYYNSLDKRTNEYKKWKALQDIGVTYQEPDGLGDFVEKVIPNVIKKAIGKDTNSRGGNVWLRLNELVEWHIVIRTKGKKRKHWYKIPIMKEYQGTQEYRNRVYRKSIGKDGWVALQTEVKIHVVMERNKRAETVSN